MIGVRDGNGVNVTDCVAVGMLVAILWVFVAVAVGVLDTSCDSVVLAV